MAARQELACGYVQKWTAASPSSDRTVVAATSNLGSDFRTAASAFQLVRCAAANNFSKSKEPVTATQVAVNTKVEESIAFGRGRQSLDRSVWYNGWLMTFLATAEETQGQFALIEAAGRRGNVPPPHIHYREEESFSVLEGEMTVSVGDRTIRAPTGTMVAVPRHTMHSFVIESEQLRVLTLLTPAGMEGWFKEFSVPAATMTLPAPAETPYSGIQEMLAAAPRFGIEFVLPKK